MTENQSNQKNKIWNSLIILFSFIGLLACTALLFPHVRIMIMDWAEQIIQREASTYQSWVRVLLSYAMGGICFILFFDYCTLTNSGRALVLKVKQEIIECLSEIKFRSFLKPSLLLFGIYFLGIMTIIRANYSYIDDLGHVASAYRGWYNWDRYVTEFATIFVHANIRLTDISPLPQLIAIFILSISSVLLINIIGNGKITLISLLATIPLGLSPFILECLTFKVDAPYMALSILASIFPFLFLARRKAFIFISVVSLLIMCMTYQAASGIYMMIVVIFCFQDWNKRVKTNKEILSFIWTSALTFCFTMLLFKLFIMRPAENYASNVVHPIAHLLSGTLSNIKEYAIIINHDFGTIWKILIAIIIFFFIAKSIYISAQSKILSFIIAITVIAILFILSFGAYSLLVLPLFVPRAMFGFGVFLAIICIYVIADYKKVATFTVLALNWCLFVFAFSYGNALSDQSRYADFRIGLLLHDLSNLYPSAGRDDLSIQINNSIDFAPTIKNISKHNPVIEKLVPSRLADTCWDYYYLLEYFNYMKFEKANWHGERINFDSLDLPVVLDSYYHTIQSDGEFVLIILKH